MCLCLSVFWLLLLLLLLEEDIRGTTTTTTITAVYFIRSEEAARDAAGKEIDVYNNAHRQYFHTQDTV